MLYCDWMKVLAASSRVGFCESGKEPEVVSTIGKIYSLRTKHYEQVEVADDLMFSCYSFGIHECTRRC